MMNKMTKGALSIGVGAALLLGGGGTLARWNAEATVAPGTIVAGDLNITANQAEGAWTNAAGVPVDIRTYKVVPGEVLTFTQKLNVTLTGDQMKARLDIANTGAVNAFTGSKLPEVAVTQMVNGQSVAVNPADLTPASLKPSNGVVTAKAVFTFNPDTSARVDANASIALGQTTFTLSQVAK